MKPLKNPKLIVGVGMIFAWGRSYFRVVCPVPTREISRAELEQFLQAKDITAGLVMPTPYAGVYRVEGTHKSGKDREDLYNNAPG